MEYVYHLLGFLLLAFGLPLCTTKRFHDVLGSSERNPGFTREHNPLPNWSSDENDWNEKLYPVWKPGDARWENSWKGGRVQAVLTSDSPALLGSNITFVVNLVFPRCQKEDANGDIVYEKNCRNESGLSPDPYVYNWSKDGVWGNDMDQSQHVFPDGRPFPHPHRWKKWNFIYIFHTHGQYFQKLGRCSARVSINTANLTPGPQVMEVTVYRRHGRAYLPIIAQVKDVYVVTDQIPVFVTMFQKNDRNSSDETFLRDLPIVFDVFIHDPSHFLNDSAIYYKWNFGDNTGLFISNNHTSNHTYVLNGTFNLNLTVQAAVPGPCPSPLSTPSLGLAGDNSLELSQISDESCQIYRFGYFKATITIVEGILEVNIIQITDVPMSGAQPDNSLVDFTVAFRGPIPAEVCTIIADPTCQSPQNVICSPADVDEHVDEMRLLSMRRAFNGPGTYCVNFTLQDDASLALTSTLISIPGKDTAFPLRLAHGVLISLSCLAIIVTVIAFLMYKKYKKYRPIENSSGHMIKSKGLHAFLHHAKAAIFPGNHEKNPLLQDKRGIP